MNTTILEPQQQNRKARRADKAWIRKYPAKQKAQRIEQSIFLQKQAKQKALLARIEKTRAKTALKVESRKAIGLKEGVNWQRVVLVNGKHGLSYFIKKAKVQKNARA